MLALFALTARYTRRTHTRFRISGRGHAISVSVSPFSDRPFGESHRSRPTMLGPRAARSPRRIKFTATSIYDVSQIRASYIFCLSGSAISLNLQSESGLLKLEGRLEINSLLRESICRRTYYSTRTAQVEFIYSSGPKSPIFLDTYDIEC